jgi:hypothetical protein
MSRERESRPVGPDGSLRYEVVQQGEPSSDNAASEALEYGRRARALVVGRYRPREEQLELALTLAAMFVEAEDPATARACAWPWLGEILRGAA